MAAEESGSGVAGAGGGEAPAPSAPNGDRSGNSPPAAESSSADDRGLHRASTMPGVIKNDEITNETVGPSNLERSRTERRRQNNPADDPAKQLFDERIPIKKKLKMLNRIATVKDDGTVVVDVPSGLEPATAGGTEDAYTEVPVDESLDGADIPYRPPMQIVILIVGTRGDVQPFVAIGKRLQNYGHRVRLATHANFKEFVLTAGLEFYPLGGDPKILAEYMVKNKGFLPSGPSEIAIQRKQIKEIIFSLLPACKDADPDTGIPFKVDAIIANPPAYEIPPFILWLDLLEKKAQSDYSCRKTYKYCKRKTSIPGSLQSSLILLRRDYKEAVLWPGWQSNIQDIRMWQKH